MPGSRGPRPYRRTDEVEWQLDELRPDLLGEVYRYKTLFGSAGPPPPDAAMGILELNPGTYPFHEHPAPEIYYVVRGQAEWTVGEEDFKAREGTAIYHAPGARHRMVNRGHDPLVAVWFWWAPGGRTGVLARPSRLSVDPAGEGPRRRER